MTVIISSSLPVALVSGTGVDFSAPVVNLISTDDVYNVNNPSESLTDLLSGISSAQLAGSASIDGTTVGNHSLYTVPTGQKFIPTSILFALTDVAGSGVGPVVNSGFTAVSYNDFIDSTLDATYDLDSGAFFAGGSGYAIGDVLSLVGGTHSTTAQLTLTQAHLASVDVNDAGTAYAPADTITLAGGTAVTAAVLDVATTKLVSATPNAAGSGYAPADTLTIAGGTHSVIATTTVATTKLVSVAVNAAGTVYVPGDTITLAGGTFSTAAVVTVLTSKLVSAAINNGGSGYALSSTFNVTVAGGTAATAALVNVSTDGTGVITTINSVNTAGSYTVLPSLVGNAVTGGTGTGLTLDLTFGVNTISITTAGSYTVNSTSFTQASTSGSGTGATFNTGLFGVNTLTVAAAGSYTVNPTLTANAATGGTGTGATLDILFGVNTITIDSAGAYTATATTFTQASSSGGGTGATFDTALFGAHAATVSQAGTYTVLPSNHVTTTGGAGTGATYDAVWAELDGDFLAIDTIGELVEYDQFITSGANYSYMTGGDVLTVRVAFPATFSTYTIKVFVFGFSFV